MALKSVTMGRGPNMLAFLAGPLGKFAIYGVIILAVLSAGGVWFHEHDVGILRAQASKEMTAVVAEQQKQYAANIKALDASHQAEVSRLVASARTRQVIASAPSTTSCPGSPAVAAVLDSMRSVDPSPGKSANPGGAAAVSSPAGPAKPVGR